jgi:hypothetical protein
MAAVTFGGNHHERLEILVAGYERPTDNDNYHDANWLTAQVKVAAGGFRGGFNAAFLTAEIDDLCTKLKELYASLKGRKEWETMEGQLRLSFQGNGLGGIELQGDALDQAGIGNRLSFRLQFDQTQLAQSMSQLDELMSKYPIRDV